MTEHCDKNLIEICKGSCAVFQGRMITLCVEDVELPNGKMAKREIVKHPGAVAVVAITDADEVIFVRQFRQAIGEVLLEIPAGKLDPGEEPLECAKRELLEETGYIAESWEKVGVFYSSPGFTNEVMHLYLAKKIAGGNARPDEDEFVELTLLNFKDALAKVDNNEINDGKTLIALLLAYLKAS